MPNLSTLEIGEIRGFFSKAFSRMVKLDPDVEKHTQIEAEWLKQQTRLLNGGEDDENDWEMN